MKDNLKERTKEDINIKSKFNFKVLIIKTIVFLIISTIILSTLLFSSFFEKYINNFYFTFNNSIVNAKLKVHFLDVGQGDCTFIELPNNETLMIDTGPYSSITNVKKYLEILGLKENEDIDYLILTHTDSDHIGSAKEIIESYNINNVFIPKVYSKYELENNLNFYNYKLDNSSLWNETVKSIYKNIDKENINYNFKDIVIEDADSNFSLIYYSPLEDNFSESNDYSPIIMLNYSSKKFMFVGDVSSNIEDDFLSYYSELIKSNYFDVDVLKVSHHGSKSSTTENFLNAVKPEIAIISCGEGNLYNHPNNETINRLTKINCKIYRTDVNSSIVCAVNNYEIFAQCNYQKFSSFYFEWWTFVVSFMVIIFYIIYFVKFDFKKNKKNDKKG